MGQNLQSVVDSNETRKRLELIENLEVCYGG